VIIERLLVAAEGFERRLRAVEPDQWTHPTPCAEWNVRQLVNHVVWGNRLNRILIVEPAAAAEHRRNRDADLLGDDPLTAFTDSTTLCAEAFREHPDAQLAYPTGDIPADRALALRATDVLVHTWDLARAIGADETLDADLVAWAEANLANSFGDMLDLPGVFAPPAGATPADVQARLLHRLGR
jgi:uncharacterized protein (TIGR03086 family)